MEMTTKILFDVAFGFLLNITSQNVDAYKAHTEQCPGAMYFAKHGTRAAWMKDKRKLCRIGNHDFYSN